MTFAFILGIISVILGISVLNKWIPKDKFEITTAQKILFERLIIVVYSTEQ